MNAAKFTLTSMILAAALGLGLSLWATPAVADQPNEEREHNHGGGSGDGDVTLFTVNLDSLISTDPWSDAGQCDGSTDIQANPGLTADFSPDQECTVTVAINEKFGLGTELELKLFRVEVWSKKSGTDLRLGFTTQDFWAPHIAPLQGDTIYVTDRLSATITSEGAPDDFFLTPDRQMSLALTKIHQPAKGAETEGVIAVGMFHYTPE